MRMRKTESNPPTTAHKDTHPTPGPITTTSTTASSSIISITFSPPLLIRQSLFPPRSTTSSYTTTASSSSSTTSTSSTPSSIIGLNTHSHILQIIRSTTTYIQIPKFQQFFFGVYPSHSIGLQLNTTGWHGRCSTRPQSSRTQCTPRTQSASRP